MNGYARVGARTLQRSQACPVLVYDCSFVLTTLEKSSGPRSVRVAFLGAGAPSAGPSPASLGRFGARACGMMGINVIGDAMRCNARGAQSTTAPTRTRRGRRAGCRPSEQVGERDGASGDGRLQLNTVRDGRPRSRHNASRRSSDSGIRLLVASATTATATATVVVRPTGRGTG
jgi:hypothetical protein